MIVGFISVLLGMLVAKWVPTPCYRDAYLVGTPKWAFLGERLAESTASPWFLLCVGRVLSGKQKDHLSIFLEGVICLDVSHIGRARHPGPGPRVVYSWSALD